MEQTLQALSGILLRAVPTAILLVILHLFLKYVLFRPLQQVLKQRESLTAGARKAADESLAAAARKAEDYESKFRDARSEVYREQEEIRKAWMNDQVKQVGAAQARSAEMITASQKQLAAETADAGKSLVETSATLADQIATSILARRKS
jgi:F-type H+-transporting ATPase subunit b